MAVNNENRISRFLDDISPEITPSITQCDLFDEADEYFKLLNIYGNTKSVEAKKSIDFAIMRVLYSLAKYTNAKKLIDIDIVKFKEALDLIKEPLYQYHERITERFQIGFRKVAAILDYVHCTNDFSQHAKVSRKSNTESQFEALISTTNDKEAITKWVDLSVEYLKQIHTKSTKNTRRALVNFLNYISKRYDRIPHPFSYMSKPRHKQFLSEYKEFEKSNTGDLTYLFRFSEFIIDNYMTEYEGDENIVIGYPIVTESQLFDYQNRSNRPKKDQTDKLLIPTSLLFLMRDIISDDDFAFPKSLSSHYFDRINENGERERVFSPVPSYLFLTMLEIPIRKIQAQMLDSGEGDLVEFRNGEWVHCTSEHAGYWKGKGASVVNRGVLRALSDVAGAGFYINTNKTQDLRVGFGEHSGYTIPWYNQELVAHFQALRNFQVKYNPVKAPIAYKNINPSFLLNDGRPSEMVLEQIPDRYYLFRDPASKHPESPISSNKLHRFFLEIMQEAEKRLKEQGENLQIITKVNEITGQPERAIYSPHGLRVAGLTAMAENGVPIEVLSKIVAGHASILMTLHYVIYSDRKVSEVLTTARKEIENQAKDGLREWLKDAAFEDAKQYLFANNDNAIAQLLSNVDAAFMTSNSYGICPYAGTRCNDGGEETKKATKTTAAKYAPVRGGKGNCVMCRHFVTGKEWTIEIWLHTNKLFEAINHLSVEIDDLREKRKSLTKQRYDFIKKQQQHLIPVTLVDDIKSLDFIIEEKSETLNDTIYSAHASYNIYNALKKLLGKNELGDSSNLGDGGSLLAFGDEGSDATCVEASKFASQHLLVAASRLYPQFNDSRIELERNHFVDQVYANSGVMPISLSPMTSDEKKVALDAASDYLLNKLSDVELKNLHSGNVKLEDLDINLEKLVSCATNNNLIEELR